MKAYPTTGGEKSFAPPAVWAARRATSSSEEKPIAPKEAMSSSVVLVGRGMTNSGAGPSGAGRPIEKLTLGAPGQTERLRAAAN